MTITPTSPGTLVLAAALSLFVASASAQTPNQLHGQKYIGPVHAAPHADVIARIDRLDERIAVLTADMRMFAGELKIQVMADLIEVLIERQRLMDRRMHDISLDSMIEWYKPAPELPEESEESPEAMCSPFI